MYVCIPVCICEVGQLPSSLRLHRDPDRDTGSHPRYPSCHMVPRYTLAQGIRPPGTCTCDRNVPYLMYNSILGLVYTCHV